MTSVRAHSKFSTFLTGPKDNPSVTVLLPDNQSALHPNTNFPS